MKNLMKISLIVLAAALFLQPGQAYAAWGRDGGRADHRAPDRGHVEHRDNDRDRGSSRSRFGFSLILNSWPIFQEAFSPRYVIQPPAQPDVVVLPAYPQTVTVAQSGFGDLISVNIPDGRGGYVTVTLRRYGTGFLGPEGDYYAEFPTVAQLQLAYLN